MKKFFALSLVLSVALAISASAATPLPQADSSWQKMSDSDHVLTHRKEVPGSDIVAFRGETVIDASLAKVANVLIDTSRKNEWVYRLAEARDIRQINELERVEYNHTSSGFFAVRDRDFVFHAKAILDREKQQMVITLNSLNDPSVPETGKVRGWLDESKYTLTQIEPGKTHLVVEIHADPKGSVPKWLVNLFQKSWPAKSLNGIRAQCAKPDVTEHAAIKRYFEETTPTTVSAIAKPAHKMIKPVAAKAPGALK